MGKKGVDVSQASSEGSDIYKLVRCSDDSATCSFRLRPGERVLLNSAGMEIGLKHLQADEHVISHDTLTEIVRELSANN